MTEHQRAQRVQKVKSKTIVAVGDVHGELEALREILRHAGILGEDDRWVGGNTVLVQTGDVIDRGPNSRGAYELLAKLQREAPEVGGRVVRLVGNHELLLLQNEDWATNVPDWQDFRDNLKRDVRSGALQGAYAGQGYLFTHAGVRSRIRVRLLADESIHTENEIVERLADKINRILLAAIESDDFSHPVFWIGPDRKGTDPIGGAFWVDASELFGSASAGKIRQVFGHTPPEQRGHTTPKQRNGIRISPSERRADIDVGIQGDHGRAYLILRKGRLRPVVIPPNPG